MEAIQKRMDKCLEGYNTIEKIKENGEVFTHLDLIEELLDNKDQVEFTDPYVMWYDPFSGLGQFLCRVYGRLMIGLESWESDETKRKRWIFEDMLYFVDINFESTKLIKQIFDPNNEYKMNLVCADAIDPDHSGWDEVGYMWDEDDIENRKLRKALREKKECDEKNNRGKNIELDSAFVDFGDQ